MLSFFFFHIFKGVNIRQYAKKKDFEAKISQKLSKLRAKTKQKLVESEAKMRYFGRYNVLIIQEDRLCYLNYFNKIIYKMKN